MNRKTALDILDYWTVNSGDREAIERMVCSHFSNSLNGKRLLEIFSACEQAQNADRHGNVASERAWSANVTWLAWAYFGVQM